MLRAIARPSRVLVPRPSSSMIARLFFPMFLSMIGSAWRLERFQTRTYLRMNAVSRISEANVETLASMQSSIDTLANSRSTIGKDAYCAGTKLPI
jgi:hypothetical protein